MNHSPTHCPFETAAVRIYYFCSQATGRHPGKAGQARRPTLSTGGFSKIVLKTVDGQQTPLSPIPLDCCYEYSTNRTLQLLVHAHDVLNVCQVRRSQPNDASVRGSPSASGHKVCQAHVPPHQNDFPGVVVTAVHDLHNA